MKRILFLMYGIFCYLTFLGTIIYAIRFLGNFDMASAIDADPVMPFFPAILIDASLLMFIVMQYNVARSPWFQQTVIRRVPLLLKRSTEILFLSLGFLVVMWRWQPLGIILWSVDDPVIQAFLKISYLTGWSILLINTIMARHFDLFGLRQAWCYCRGQKYIHAPVLEPGHYQLIRHPFYIGFLLVCWSASLMTLGHLLLTLIVTRYVALEIQQERKGPVMGIRNHYIQYED